LGFDAFNFELSANLMNRKKKTIKMPITTSNDLYPYYDSLSSHAQSIKVWVDGKYYQIALLKS